MDQRQRAREYLMSEIARMGEDFGPTSPIGIAIDAANITDARVMSWELYGAIMDVLREEQQRYCNRNAGADATGRNQMGRIARARAAAVENAGKATQQEGG